MGCVCVCVYVQLAHNTTEMRISGYLLRGGYSFPLFVLLSILQRLYNKCATLVNYFYRLSLRNMESQV